MQIRITKLSLKDLDSFFPLLSKVVTNEFPEYTPGTRQFFLTHPHAWSKASYRAVLKHEIRFVIGAYIGKTLVGLLDAEYAFGGSSFCHWLVVDPDHHRIGVGKRLLEAWEEEILKQDGHFLMLYADERNKTYYTKMGFKVSGHLEKPGFGADVDIFTKLIQEPKEENFLK